MQITGSGDVLAIQGNTGDLFTVSDELSGSLFRVNTEAGVPAFEVKSDYSVGLGTNANILNVDTDNVGIAMGLYLDKPGCVSLGQDNTTSSPASSLHIRPRGLLVDAQVREGIRIERGSVTNQYMMLNCIGGAASYTAVVDDGSGAHGGHTWYSHNSSVGDPTARMALLGNGNLGIGTTSPSKMLQVQAVGGDTPTIGLYSYDTATPGKGGELSFHRSDSLTVANHATQDNQVIGSILWNGMDSGDGAEQCARIEVFQVVAEASQVQTKMIFETGGVGGSNSNQLVLDTDGQVGINTATPDAELHVTGTAYITSGIYISAAAESNRLRAETSGASHDNLWFGDYQIVAASDRRVKSDITDTVLNGIEVVNKLRVVDFK